MKWLIGSDLHGSEECCDKLMEAYRKEEAERMLLLGDILFKSFGNRRQKQAVADKLNTMAERIVCVRGNCDSDEDLALLAFPVQAGYVKIPLEGRTLFATHGDQYNENDPPAELAEGDILLHGHTHIPMARECGGFMCFNPGSVSQPLGGSIRGYMTMEDGLFTWFTLEGEPYRQFDTGTWTPGNA